MADGHESAAQHAKRGHLFGLDQLLGFFFSPLGWILGSR